MLENLPWPEVLLGIAAALAILVIYDVFYVWPIHRRISALTERCAVVERRSAACSATSPRASRRAITREREDIGRLGERLGQLERATDSGSYEQAIGCAEKGEETSRLISCFGLTEGEADLVMLLHGEASRRAGRCQVRHPTN